MDLHSGYPYWLLKNGYLFPYSSLDKNISADVLIIGAGISGALIGYYLANSGVQVTLVDKRMPGTGSTSASTALLQYEIDKSLVELSDHIGKENATAAYLICLDAIHKLKHIARRLNIDTEFELKKSIYLASGKNKINPLRKEYEARKHIGIRLDYLDQKELNKKFSLDAPAALLSYDSAQMDCFRFTHGLLQAVKQKGGKIFSHTEIKKLNTEPRGMKLLTANKNMIKAKRVVFATGYESFVYIDPPLTTLHSTYAATSEIMDHTPVDYLLWETARPYFYLRSTKDKRIMIGGKDEDFYNPAKRDKLIREKSTALIRKFNSLFPSVKFKPEFEWTGTFAETPDGLPYIGVHPRYPNAYFALGYGGNGITFSLIAAEIIRDLFHRKKNKYASIFSFDR